MSGDGGRKLQNGKVVKAAICKKYPRQSISSEFPPRLAEHCEYLWYPFLETLERKVGT